MYWLKNRLHVKSAVDKDQTYRYKLPEIGLYSAFSIRLQAIRYANRSGAATNPMLHDDIDKVEFLSEGTKVIKSMRAREIKALNLFDFRRVGDFQHEERAGGYNMDTLYLLAGRGLYDKEYMFDMSKFRDPELAITNSLDEGTGDGQWTADSLEYQIFGWRAMGAPLPTPKGYMRADERLYYSTTSADTEKAVQITTGKKIRRLLLMGHTVGTTVYGHVKKAELQVDEGVYSPVIIPNPLEWCWQNVLDYDLDILVPKHIYLPDASINNKVDLLMCYPQAVEITQYADATGHSERVRSHDTGLATIVNAAAGELRILSRGAGYLNSILIGFDERPDLANMLDTKPMGVLKLILIEGGATKVVSLVVEEEILY